MIKTCLYGFTVLINDLHKRFRISAKESTSFFARGIVSEMLDGVFVVLAIKATVTLTIYIGIINVSSFIINNISTSGSKEAHLPGDFWF